MKTTGNICRMITISRRAAMTLLLAMTALTAAWAQVDVPLTLEAIADGTTITVTDPKSGMQYSINGGAKQPVTTDPFSISAGQAVQFYGNGTSITSYDGTWIKCSNDCYIYGNIMSLVDENDFATATTLTAVETFFGLFSGNTHLKNHPTNKLVLPATTLKEACYDSMFQGCTSLTVAPELPAKTLAVGCYDGMFGGCTSLTTAPELPATTLADYCYASMFSGCTGLTNAPELPATTLAPSCYSNMFYGCTNLSYVRCLATNIEARDCTSDWLKDVASSGIFAKAPGMEGWTTGISGIPEGWTVKSYTSAPALTLEAIGDGTTITVTNPKSDMQYSINGGTKTALTTGNNQIQVSAGQKVQFYGNGTSITSYNGTKIQCSNDCYIYGNIMSLVDENDFATATTLTAVETFSGLFSGNTHLKNHPTNKLVLPATTLTESCYQGMFQGCTSLTTAPELPATELTVGCYDGMFKNCRALTEAPDLPATTLEWVCYNSMFYNCKGLTTAPRLPATTLADYCYASMFSGCTGLTNAPELPATTLAPSCYSNMFYGCTNLSYVRCLATNIEASDCTSEWLKDVATQGTFVKAENTNWRTGVSGIPEGWTVVEGMKGHPLTLEAIADGTITVMNPKSGMQYSIDGGTKTALTTATTEIPVSAGQKVQFYGNGTRITSYSGTRIQCSADCYIYGNIMSLVDENYFEDNTTLTEAGAFSGLFYDNTHLRNHPDHQLVLPATTLVQGCYSSMFSGCDGLTTTPELPATELADNCYESMFFGCSGLTTAPELPATELADNCYESMFFGCSGLTTAPELPATELKRDCYKDMFYDCTSLNYVKCLATNISATECTSAWLKNVAAQGTFLKAAGMEGWDSGTSGIPGGWTVKSYTSAPALTLEAIADGTITVTNPKSGMQYSIDGGTKQPVTAASISVAAGQTVQFYGNDTNITSYNGTKISCTKDCYIYGNIMSLVDENDFATATTLTADYAFTGLFLGNDHLRNHPDKPLVLPAMTLTESCYQGIFGGCTGLTDAPVLPATTLAVGCYASMFFGCTSLTEPPALPATTLTASCYSEMFRYCTSLQTAPVLSAAVLAYNCYANMFKDCSSLNYVKCLATDISATTCTKDWLIDVDASGTFVKADGMEDWPTGISGIPEGWTVFEAMQVQPLTLEAIADGTIMVTSPKSGMQYSIDGGAKTAITTTATTEIPVSAGQKVLFYGNGTSITSYYRTQIRCSADYYIYGNVMSLVDETGFATATTLTEDNAFFQLFYDYYRNDYLKNHPDKPLLLPATTLTKNCYQGMFARCTSLTQAPELPAMELKNDCYRSMFSGCTALTAVPELPATTLAEQCYYSMFEGCTSLTEAPELPATTLAERCYRNMFNGCTSLIKAPKLSATELASGCYEEMFQGCTSLTEAPDLPATELAMRCYRFMFYGCTNLIKAPVLPAATLAKNCYDCMFDGCRKLNYLKCLATDISAEDCTHYMLYGVAAQGLFVKAEGMTDWSTGVSGIPEGWTVSGANNSITLYDTGDNRATVEAKNNQTMDYVVLDGRTLYRDGTWNSLCLPLNVGDFTGTPLEGADVRTLSTASFQNGTLTLTFTPASGEGAVTAITAGMPYIVRWTTTGTDINNPVFENVTIVNASNDITIDNVITFKGTYASTTYAAEDKSILFLGASNTLYYPKAGATIGACHAYFELADGITAADPTNPVKNFVLNFDDERPTLVSLPLGREVAGAWYDLQGRKIRQSSILNHQLPPGIYIHNGKKVIVTK